MSDTLTQSTTLTDADYEASIQMLLEEMNRLESNMDQVQAESDRIKSETQVIKAITEGKLARLEEQIISLTRAA